MEGRQLCSPLHPEQPCIPLLQHGPWGPGPPPPSATWTHTGPWRGPCTEELLRAWPPGDLCGTQRLQGLSKPEHEPSLEPMPLQHPNGGGQLGICQMSRKENLTTPPPSPAEVCVRLERLLHLLLPLFFTRVAEMHLKIIPCSQKAKLAVDTQVASSEGKSPSLHKQKQSPAWSKNKDSRSGQAWLKLYSRKVSKETWVWDGRGPDPHGAERKPSRDKH